MKKIILGAIGAVIVLAGCGQKGNLYLPTPSPAPAPAASSMPAK